jgi:pimeloyl-ACP methyl ester carboxylesterase
VANTILFRQRFIYLAEEGKIMLPAARLFHTPLIETTGTIIYLKDSGLNNLDFVEKTTDLERIEELAKEGKTVIAVDLRGLGQTQATGSRYFRPEQFGTDARDFFLAYLLGKNYVGMRTEDLLAVVREQQHKPVEIVASGETVGLVALHAAVLEPTLISSVKLDTPLRNWYDVVKEDTAPYPISNIVHGALLEYDVPDLKRLLGQRLREQ